MSIFQRFIRVLSLITISFAGVIEQRQAVETFASCIVNPASTASCPNTYCVCHQPKTTSISGTTTTFDIVNMYATTSGPAVCPTPGAAVSEAGCQIIVESKTDSTCGAVAFNTKFCLPSSTGSISSSSTPSATPAQGAPKKIQSTVVQAPPSITPAPSYEIVGQSYCVVNGVTATPTLTPLQTCDSLTAPYNCMPYALLPWSTADPQSASYTGCACGEDSWGSPAYSTVQVAQGGGQRGCNPSDFSNGPWAEILSVTNTPSFFDLVPNCNKWLADNTADWFPSSNPCSGFPYQIPATASCTYIPEADALGQENDMCSCTNKSPKYRTDWFGDCPSSGYVTFSATTTIG